MTCWTYRRLRRLARPELQGPCNACGKTWTPPTRWHSSVCPCGVTCYLPGPLPPNVQRIAAKLGQEENQQVTERLINEYARAAEAR